MDRKMKNKVHSFWGRFCPDGRGSGTIGKSGSELVRPLQTVSKISQRYWAVLTAQVNSNKVSKRIRVQQSKLNIEECRWNGLRGEVATISLPGCHWERRTCRPDARRTNGPSPRCTPRWTTQIFSSLVRRRSFTVHFTGERSIVTRPKLCWPTNPREVFCFEIRPKMTSCFLSVFEDTAEVYMHESKRFVRVCTFYWGNTFLLSRWFY